MLGATEDDETAEAKPLKDGNSQAGVFQGVFPLLVASMVWAPLLPAQGRDRAAALHSSVGTLLSQNLHSASWSYDAPGYGDFGCI